MRRGDKQKKAEARRLFLTGELSTNAEIASHLAVKPHTIGAWRRQEDWDGLRRKVDRRAAEMFIEKLATDRVALNTQHFKLWGLVLTDLLGSLQGGKEEAAIRRLERAAGIIERAQKGQRLARGLSTDGETEEQIRAEAQARQRHLIDVFIDSIKENVADEEAKDRIRRAILDALPEEEDEGAGEPGDEVDH